MRKISFFVMELLALLGLTLTVGLAPVAADILVPQTIALPNGFQPEGIAVGRSKMIYAGSRATGAIYRADLLTGQGSILVPPQTGRAALGLEVDRRTNYLFVAGGGTGNAYVYNAATGADLGVFSLSTASARFINDEIILGNAVYFTDSARPVLYRLPLLPGGRLSASATIQEIPLGGEFEFIPGAFNANGIETTPDGQALIVVNSSVGALYRVDPMSGDSVRIDLGGGSVAAGDGIHLVRNTLFVVQNSFNRIAVVDLDSGATSGEIVQLITDPRFDVPTTIDDFAGLLYVVNARFSTPPTPTTTYTIENVKMPKISPH